MPYPRSFRNLIGNDHWRSSHRQREWPASHLLDKYGRFVVKSMAGLGIHGYPPCSCQPRHSHLSVEGQSMLLPRRWVMDSVLLSAKRSRTSSLARRKRLTWHPFRRTKFCLLERRPNQAGGAGAYLASRPYGRRTDQRRSALHPQCHRTHSRRPRIDRTTRR